MSSPWHGDFRQLQVGQEVPADRRSQRLRIGAILYLENIFSILRTTPGVTILRHMGPYPNPVHSAHDTTDPIAMRIRARRESLGLTYAETARRAGLKAPSFVHHIESGLRLPSEEVAARLAVALGEDEALFRAWARARGGAPLDQALAAAHTIESKLAGPATGVPAPAALMRVPLLRYGDEPDAAKAGGVPEPEILRFDARTLPAEAWLRPFAYRLGEELPRCAGRLAAGDLVVLTRNAWPIHPDTIYAARALGRVVLSPLEWRVGTLWLRSAGGEDADALPPSGAPPGALVGRVAAVIRAGAS